MRDRGFTLLEVLVAFTLLALVLGAAYAAMGTGLRAQARSAEVADGVSRAQSALARLGRDWPLTPGEQRFRDGDWVTAVTIAPYRRQDRQRWQELGLQPLRVAVSVRSPSGRQAARLETLRLGPVE